jgi:hypothetical protein
VELILIALVAAKATEYAKELLPWATTAWTKSAFSLLVSVVVGTLAGTEVLVIGGAWGLSALVHELQGVLAMISDYFKLQILLRGASRRR